jgi:hypothetical protein
VAAALLVAAVVLSLLDHGDGVLKEDDSVSRAASLKELQGGGGHTRLLWMVDKEKSRMVMIVGRGMQLIVLENWLLAKVRAGRGGKKEWDAHQPEAGPAGQN